MRSVIAFFPLVIVGCGAHASGVADALSHKRVPLPNDSDWPTYNRTLEGDRFAPQSALTPATVGRLKVVCRYDLGRMTSFQTGPLVIAGVMYFTTDFDTIAIDAISCKEKWRTTEAYKAAGPLQVNRGAAVADGRVFRGTQDGRVLAYAATTGKRLWETTIADAALGETVPAALIAWGGLVFAGNAGGDNKAVKGRMYALEAATGRIVWEQYLVPREARDRPRGPAAPRAELPAADEWGNGPDAPITGGATWTSYSLDTSTGLLYVPGGNPAPDFVPQLRPGKNPFSGSLVVLEARTGAVRSTYPLVERDFHDWDVSAAPAIVTTKGGRRVVAEAIKNGRVYGLDATRPRELWNAATATITNPTAPLTPSGTRFCPGTQGGTEWNGPGFSPTTNLFYVGALDRCVTVTTAPDAAVAKVEPGRAWSGAASVGEPFGKADPQDSWAGWVTAVDADSGRVAWKRKLPSPVLSAVTPTAGGLVFVGDMAGHLYALDALSGATLLDVDTGGALGGGIISYATPAGEQRVAVAAGMTSPIWPTTKVDAQVIVYGL